MPPTLGYLEGAHTELRHKLGLLVEDLDQVRDADRIERERMVSRLKEGGFIHEDHPSDEELLLAMHALLHLLHFFWLFLWWTLLVKNCRRTYRVRTLSIRIGACRFMRLMAKKF